MRALVLAGLLLAAWPLRASATGFAWYAILFDYETLEAQFDAEFDAELTRLHSDIYGEPATRRSSDAALFELIYEQSEVYGVVEPSMFDAYDNPDALLVHDELMQIAERIENTHPSSPLRHVLTGRRFEAPGRQFACTSDFVLMAGACRTYIMLTTSETEIVFWQLDALRKDSMWTQDPMRRSQLRQLHDVFKEAVLRDKAVFIHGHD